VDKIISGEKIYEFRKVVWKKNKNIKMVIIYASAPIQKIIGYFIIDKIIKGPPAVVWQHCGKGAGITKELFFDYFKNHELAFAIRIGRLEVFSEPLSPQELDVDFNPPQNYSYLRSEAKCCECGALLYDQFYETPADLCKDCIIKELRKTYLCMKEIER